VTTRVKIAILLVAVFCVACETATRYFITSPEVQEEVCEAIPPGICKKVDCCKDKPKDSVEVDSTEGD